MKNLLIAAGMAATMLFAAPALAAPAPAGTGISAPQDMRDGQRNDRGDRADRDRGDRGDRGNWNNNRGGNRWGGRNRWCHNVRRHHRWVRVCGRR